MGENGTTVRYRIDPTASRFVVQAFADGLLSVFGHNPTIAICGFGGDVRFIPNTLEEASLLMLIKSDSLAVVDKVSAKDRLEIERAMREDVMEIARYPEIVFMTTNVRANPLTENLYRVLITGKLTLHGVTRDCPLDAQVTLNEDSLHAQGEFKLRQTDYGIKPTSVAAGTLKVKDELQFSFDIEAQKEEG